MTVVGQTQVTYTYDNANRLTTITQGTDTVTLAYDDADRRTSVTYPNTNKIEYGYNVASELTSLTYKQGTTTLGDLTYTYDAAGNRIKTAGTYHHKLQRQQSTNDIRDEYRDLRFEWESRHNYRCRGATNVCLEREESAHGH